MTDRDIETRFAKGRAITGIDYSKFKDVMTEEEMENSGIPCVRARSESEAARQLGISNLTLQRARKRGEISYLQIGRRVVYLDFHIAEFAASAEKRKLTTQSSNAPTKGTEENAGD